MLHLLEELTPRGPAAERPLSSRERRVREVDDLLGDLSPRAPVSPRGPKLQVVSCKL